MLDCIPGLINAIRMINSHSRWYNTPRRITSLFVKITNQIVTSCKEYITENGHKTVSIPSIQYLYYIVDLSMFPQLWEIDIPVAESRIHECLRLNEEYQKAFHHTRTKLEELPDEKQFDFSEMYIFGKFNNFCRRY